MDGARVDAEMDEDVRAECLDEFGSRVRAGSAAGRRSPRDRRHPPDGRRATMRLPAWRARPGRSASVAAERGAVFEPRRTVAPPPVACPASAW